METSRRPCPPKGRLPPSTSQRRPLSVHLLDSTRVPAEEFPKISVFGTPILWEAKQSHCCVSEKQSHCCVSEPPFSECFGTGCGRLKNAKPNGKTPAMLTPTNVRSSGQNRRLPPLFCLICPPSKSIIFRRQEARLYSVRNGRRLAC
jgi:hypothetical protein